MYNLILENGLNVPAPFKNHEDAVALRKNDKNVVKVETETGEVIWEVPYPTQDVLTSMSACNITFSIVLNSLSGA